MKRTLASSLAAACLALGACEYSYSPVTVVVKERLTEERVEGARVVLDYARTINPSPPKTAEGITDAEGRVTLDAAVYNRLVVYVTPAGGFEHVFAADHPAAYGASGWINTYTDKNGNPAKVVIRVLPAGE